MSPETPKTALPFSTVAIVGAGQGGATLLEILAKEACVKVVGIADIHPEAPGMRLAKKLGIPTMTDFRDLITPHHVDVIINVTNSPALDRALHELRRPGTEIMSGVSALLMWRLIEERNRAKAEVDRQVTEYQALFDLGVKQTSAESPEELFDLIVEYATSLTKTPAGSLAVYDEATGILRLAAAKGFSPTFMAHGRWQARPGGLSSRILSVEGPLICPDLERLPQGVTINPVLLEEKVRSLMAIPLTAERRIVGILYVNDFTVRDFTPREASLLSLLSTLAAMAIHRLLMIEQDRFLDELTGLYNYRFFMRQIALEMDRLKRAQRPFCLLMVDIDHFKLYNDAQGHLKGSELLREMAFLLKQACRKIDVIARYGGEEFAIIMPETEADRAGMVAERLRESIERHPFTGDKAQPGGHLTISVGAAAAPAHATTVKDLIEHADQALYHAKRAGRNQSVVYTPGLGGSPPAGPSGLV